MKKSREWEQKLKKRERERKKERKKARKKERKKECISSSIALVHITPNYSHPLFSIPSFLY